MPTPIKMMTALRASRKSQSATEAERKVTHGKKDKLKVQASIKLLRARGGRGLGSLPKPSKMVSQTYFWKPENGPLREEKGQMAPRVGLEPTT